MKGDKFMDENKNIAYEKSTDFDSVEPTATGLILPIPVPLPGADKESSTNAKTSPKPETTKDNLQYSDK